MERFSGLLGMAAIMLLAYALSNNRKAIQMRVVFWGLGLQWLFAFLVLKTPFRLVLEKVRDGGMKLLSYSESGSSFVFGTLGGAAADATPVGFVFAFRVLTIVIFIASF